MMPNPFLTQRLAEVRVREALREAERARLLRLAQAAGRERKLRLVLALALQVLLGLAGGGSGVNK